ncbi:uncharacterized protein [Drosophila tropicalis]|uniref:uncharacterized protein n=1 Tax=Drosophila tropicalis TaxID=46794 RepID=UPI0035ABCA8C
MARIISHLIDPLLASVHHLFLVFALLELSLLLCEVQPTIKLEHISRFYQRPTAQLSYSWTPLDLAYTLVYSGFAMIGFLYGYGLVHLRLNTTGIVSHLLMRLCVASMAIWQRSSLLMILPWSLKGFYGICQNICQLYEYMSNEAYYNARQFNVALWLCIIYVMAVLSVTSICFVMALRLHQKLMAGRQIDRYNQGIYSYARSINLLLGFQMIDLTT